MFFLLKTPTTIFVFLGRGRKLLQRGAGEKGGGMVAEAAFTVSTCGLSFPLASTLSKPITPSQNSAFISLFEKDLKQAPTAFSHSPQNWNR